MNVRRLNYILKMTRWGTLLELVMLEIVIIMESELKGIYVKHLFITKNPQRWRMLLEHVMLDTVIILESELKQICAKHTCIIKKQQKWEIYLHSVCVIF